MRGSFRAGNPDKFLPRMAHSTTMPSIIRCNFYDQSGMDGARRLRRFNVCKLAGQLLHLLPLGR